MNKPTIVADGLEPVPQSNYPEAVHPPPINEKGPSPGPVAPHRLPLAFSPNAPEKRICGLRRTTFILLVLLALVIVAASVGGGVGGSRAVDGAYERGFADGSTEAGDSDPGGSEGRIKTPTTGRVELDCPSLSDTTHEIRVGNSEYKFIARCGIRHPSGDLVRLPAYSFRDCLMACAAYNDFNATDRNCIATQFNSMLDNEKGGNCWLKYEIGNTREDENKDTRNNFVAAERYS